MDQQLTHNQQPLTKKQRREQKREEQAREATMHKKRAARKRVLLWSTAIAGVILIVASLSWMGRQQASTETNTVLTSEVTAEDHVKGNTNSDIILVEYSDFQCPACASWAPVVEQIIDDYGDDIQFVYRHYPLKKIHFNAEDAARAAEAASKQGAFFDMHDLLFRRQASWSNLTNPDKTFSTYAEELGLDVDQFKKDYASDDVDTRVDRDYASGNQAGINGTPTFFLNGKIIDRPAGYEGLANAIDDALHL